jgi:hypothetical protein
LIHKRPRASRIFPTLAPTQVAGPVRFRVRSDEVLIIYAVGTFPDTFNILSQRVATGPLAE